MLRCFRSVLAVIGVGLSAVPAGAAAPPAPDALGPYAVGHTVFEAYDPARDRTLPVHVWYPVHLRDAQGPSSVYSVFFLGLASQVALEDAPPIRGRAPLVVFSHGNGGVGVQSFFLTETLASHGFVVAAPDHVGNTLLDVLFGNVGEAEVLQSGLDRPRDVSFVIDTLLARSADATDPLYRTVNPFRIGVAGHSFGGFTALAVAAGFDGEAASEFGVPLPDGFEPIPADPRVRAVVPIAPATFPLGDGELGRIRIPVLLVGGTRDLTTPLDPNVTRPFALIPSNALYRADLQGAAHFSFTHICDLVEIALDAGIPADFLEDVTDSLEDDGCGPGLLSLAETYRLTNLVAVSFLRRHLAYDSHYDRWLDPARLQTLEPDLDFFRNPLRVPRWLWLLLMRVLGVTP